MGITFGKNNAAVTERLQTVYDRIKRERPWDIRIASKMYITTKEKYLIELIKEGQCLSNEMIDHVISGCDEIHNISDGEYACCYGYILKEKKYRFDLSDCESLRKINKRLFCHDGVIFYPADLLSNPFDKWGPFDSTASPEVQEVYDMIKQKWSDQNNLDESHKNTLKHLVDLIVRGEPVSKQVKSHVIYGCERNEEHILDDNYICDSGFLMRKRKSGDISKHERWRILKIQERIINNKPYMNMADYIAISNRKGMKRFFERICHRDVIRHQSTTGVSLTVQEHYLIDCMMSGDDVPNEVISHVVEGCHARGHLLTEQYACYGGYIRKRETFFQQDIRECRSYHEINNDLTCSNGNINHLSIFKLESSESCDSVRSGNAAANPRLPPRPVPIPPDHLDDPPVQQPVARNLLHIDAAHIIRQRNNEINDDVDAEAIVENVAPNLNRQPNAAPPPPEFDI